MFLEHSDEEETHPGSLADLASKLSANENHALAKAFVAARKVVPTRPHPMQLFFSLFSQNHAYRNMRTGRLSRAALCRR